MQVISFFPLQVLHIFKEKPFPLQRVHLMLFGHCNVPRPLHFQHTDFTASLPLVPLPMYDPIMVGRQKIGDGAIIPILPSPAEKI